MKLLKRGTGNELRALRIELNGSLVSYCMRDKIYISRRFRLHSTSLTSVAFCYKLHLPQLRSRNDILGSHLKVNFKKSDLRSLYRDYLCSSTTLKKEINTFVCLDCVASVSNWVIARKLERQRKKKCEGEGVGSWAEETAFPSLPSLPPSFLLFVIASTFSTNPLGNACYTGYRVPSCFFSCLLLPWEIRCHSIY